MVPDPYRTDDDHKFGESVQEITERMTFLVREEIELAKAEVEVKAKSLARGAAIGAAAGVFALFGLFVLVFGIAFAWDDLVFTNSISLGFIVTAFILFVIGGVAGFGASRLFKKGSPPTPDLAIEEAKRIRDTVQSQGGR